jgi:hypothetical protein
MQHLPVRVRFAPRNVARVGWRKYLLVAVFEAKGRAGRRSHASQSPGTIEYSRRIFWR